MVLDRNFNGFMIDSKYLQHEASFHSTWKLYLAFYLALRLEKIITDALNLAPMMLHTFVARHKLEFQLLFPPSVLCKDDKWTVFVHCNLHVKGIGFLVSYLLFFESLKSVSCSLKFVLNTDAGSLCNSVCLPSYAFHIYHGDAFLQHLFK